MNERLAAARLRLYRVRPFLGVALWSLTPVESERVSGLAVDPGFRLHYNVRFCEKAPVQELALWLYHLVMHLAAGHFERAEALGADPVCWNLAADLAVNSALEAEGLLLPRGWPVPRQFGLPPGLTAEEYYRRLLSRGPLGGWACGGLKFEAGGLSAAEARGVLARLAREVAAARGSVPGWWRRWAEVAARGRVDWARELRAAVRSAVAEAAGESDFSYGRLSRRTVRQPEIIFPGLIDPVPEVAVVVDTSASVTDSLLGRMVSEVAGVLRALGYREVTVLAVDAAVQAVSRGFSARQVRLKGGGGTDVGVGLSAAARLRPRPQVVVVLTDGQTPWPEAPPRGVRVVACLFGGRAWPVPGWVRAVVVDE